MVEHALFCVVNLLTGSEQHKEAVMQSNLPALVMHYLRSGAIGGGGSALRVPALWCIINLSVSRGSAEGMGECKGGLKGKARLMMQGRMVVAPPFAVA